MVLPLAPAETAAGLEHQQLLDQVGGHRRHALREAELACERSFEREVVGALSGSGWEGGHRVRSWRRGGSYKVRRRHQHRERATASAACTAATGATTVATTTGAAITGAATTGAAITTAPLRCRLPPPC